MTAYSPWMMEFAGGDFAVGNSWTWTDLNGNTVEGKVTGTETYGGQESYVGEITVNGDLAYKSAFRI